MKKLIVILSLLVIIFTGCSSVIKIQESYRADNYDFTLLHDSNIKFAGPDKIYLKEFVNTFKDEYSDKNKLNDKLYELFSIEFKKQIPGTKLSRLELKIPTILSGNLSFKEYNKNSIDSFFISLDTDYLVFVNSIEIGNAIDSYQHYNASTGTYSSSSTEDCIVLLEVECWDVINQERILRFKGIGSDTVNFWAFLSSLNDAMEKAVSHSVEFIKNEGIYNY